MFVNQKYPFEFLSGNLQSQNEALYTGTAGSAYIIASCPTNNCYISSTLIDAYANGLYMAYASGVLPSGEFAGTIALKNVSITNSSNCGIYAPGGARVVVNSSSALTGTGNAGGGICQSNGSSVQISATTDITGTAGDVMQDGSAVTYVAIRAATPKSVLNAATLTRTFQP